MPHVLRSTPALAVLLLGACVRPPSAGQSPAPVTVVSTPAPAPATPRRDSAAVPRTAAPSAAARRVDSIARHEITRQAVGVFGDSVVTDVAMPGEGDAEEVSWDIDVRSYETHASVEHYVRYFSGTARARIAERLERGTRYEPMIRAKFRAAGIPEDMYYLALIESGYDNNAYSRAAAVGMWQFMATTARGMGMRVDWWVDERRDPVRATEGATRFLRWLNEQLGSYYLAAAAYNGGPGRVSRGLTRFASDLEGETGDAQFFSLAEKDYLPRETKNYVPQLIAAALVGKAPERYGMTVTPREPFAYDSVRVGPATPIAAVARASRSTVSELVELNPHVLRGVTPPGGSGMWVRVPVGRADGFEAAFEAIDEDDRRPWRRIASKTGDTKASFASAHGITVKQLEWYNLKLTTTKRGRLHPGQVILVPSSLTLAAARDVPDPGVERYGSAPKGSAVRYHVVKRGESLGLIARRNNTTVANLKRMNGLRKDIVVPGQQLRVSGSVPKGRGAAGGTSGTRLAGTKRASSSRTPALSTKAASPATKKASGTSKGSATTKAARGTRAGTSASKAGAAKKAGTNQKAGATQKAGTTKKASGAKKGTSAASTKKKGA